jgi:hypothetical protein
MATNWINITQSELGTVLQDAMIAQANENVPKQDFFDASQTNRVGLMLAACVAEVRAAIQRAGRYPLSVTADAVPPEAHRHVLNLIAYQVLASTPNLAQYLTLQNGASSPAQKLYDEARAFIEGLAKGNPVTAATDPTGRDYLTAVADDNPAVCAVWWSDMRMTKEQYNSGEKDALDMTTDGA